jgi:Mannose-6-phosphate isomerase
MTRTIQKVSIEAVAANTRRGGDLRILLSPRTVGATSGFMGAGRLAPGEHISEHYHPYSEEFLFLVRGNLVARVDGDREIALGPGDALMVPKSIRHCLDNVGDEEAFFVFHASPLAPRPELGHVDTEAVRGADTGPGAVPLVGGGGPS